MLNTVHAEHQGYGSSIAYFHASVDPSERLVVRYWMETGKHGRLEGPTHERCRRLLKEGDGPWAMRATEAAFAARNAWVVWASDLQAVQEIDHSLETRNGYEVMRAIQVAQGSYLDRVVERLNTHFQARRLESEAADYFHPRLDAETDVAVRCRVLPVWEAAQTSLGFRRA